MITRWTFYFDQENIRSDVSNPDESDRIKEYITACPDGMLSLPGDKAHIYINLARVKCIVCIDVSDEQLQAEKQTAIEPSKVEVV